jgi:lipopolysaccharide/colanic/teichoic acid biosynthesis glycosyltransferase
VNRPTDLALTLAIAPAVLPACALAALAIRLADGGPVLFVQERVGRRRRPFAILKLRTMRDGRVTTIGALLRATGLDELPQLANVLRGEIDDRSYIQRHSTPRDHGLIAAGALCVLVGKPLARRMLALFAGAQR